MVIKPFVAALEKRYSSSPLFFSLYALPYRGVVRRELALARVRSGETVLAIGCGALPFTAVLAAQMADVTVVAVDCDRHAVESARMLIGHLKLQDRITVVHADAAVDPLPAADVVLVALQAAPKGAILGNLLRCGSRPHATDNSKPRLVFRLPRPGLEREYGTLPEFPRAAAVPSAFHRFPTFDRSVMIPRITMPGAAVA